MKKKKQWVSLFLAAALVAQSALPVSAAQAGYGEMSITQEEVQSRAAEAVRTWLSEEEYGTQGVTIAGNEAEPYKVSAEDLNLFEGLGSATMTATFKTSASGIQALFAVNGRSEPSSTNNYISLYVNGSTLGSEIRNNTDTNLHIFKDTGIALNNGKWHTATLTVSKDQYYRLYIDGVKLLEQSAASTSFVDNLGWALHSVTFGRADRGGGNNYPFQGNLKNIKFYNSALSEADILADHETTIKDKYDEDTLKTEEYGLFDMGDYDAYNYRIPALATTTEGTLIAAADRRATHWNDWGNIDTVIRRSTDNGKTWDDPITVLDLKTQPYFTGTQSAFAIDPCVVVEGTKSANSGRIWMLVDLFPESTGFGSANAGSGYVEKDGQKYLALYDTARAEYTVRENGVVYDSQGTPTDYAVKLDTKMPHHEYGDLYENDEYKGNIFLKSTGEDNDTAPLTVLVTSYLCLTYSDDDGTTWSQPRILNGEVKEEWMKFIGTGPGVGIQLTKGSHAGRLIFPIYYTNGNGKQSSANIYSDDNGLTWHRGKSPNDGRINDSGQVSDSQEMNGLSELTESQIVELNNGHLVQFMRNTGGSSGKVAVSVSADGGETWGDVTYTEAPEVYCQLSVIHCPDLINGSEYVLMSNPDGPSRSNGALRLGKVNADDTITWEKSKMFRSGNYAYSCLAAMSDGNYGLMYEHSNAIKFTSFNLNFLDEDITLNNPVITSISCEVEKRNPDRASIQPGDTMNITAVLDQPVFTTGSPSLRINLNGSYRHASYVSGGNGDSTMLFSYTIPKGDQGSTSFLGPKIVCDENSSVKNKHGYSVSSGDLNVDLGYIGYDPTSELGEVPLDKITATAGSEHSGQGAMNVLDGNEETLWHTEWSSGYNRKDHWLLLDLGDVYTVKGFRYQPRQSGGINGIITQYRIEVSTDNVTYTPAGEGSWAQDNAWKLASFTPVRARYVRLVSTASASGEAANEYTSAAEVRVLATEFEEDKESPDAPDNLEVSKITSGSAKISWEAAIDNVGVTGYSIAYGIAGQEKQSISLPSELLSTVLADLQPESHYEIEVTAYDAAGNVSLPAKASFTTLKAEEPKDTEVPSAPKNLQAYDITTDSAVISWDASTDNVGVTGYTVTYRIAGQAKQTISLDGAALSATLTALKPETTYEVEVTAEDAAGNVSSAASLTFSTKKPAPVDPNPGEDPKPGGNPKPGEDPKPNVELKSVKLNVSKITLGAKEKLTLKATASPSSAELGKLTFKSSNQKVAKVTAKGVVTAGKKGKATITVTAANGKKATCKVTVKNAPKKITLTAKKKTLRVKKTLQLKAKLNRGSAGKITFKSSNRKVATVDSKGKVTAKKKGKVTITATTYNKKKAKITIKIK